MKYFALTILLFFSGFISAQSKDSLLRYDKYSKKVYSGNRQMSLGNLTDLMSPFPESFDLIQSAHDCKIFSSIFYTAGSAAIGYTIGYYLPSKELKLTPLMIGAGLIGIAIPINIRYLKQMQRAVKSYNGRYKTTGHHGELLDLSLNFSPNGIGLKLKL
jgi:hypothetical protein